VFGGLLNKIAVSLGKSFVFAGLLPAAVMLVLAYCYWLGIDEVIRRQPDITLALTDAKQLSFVAILWIAVGFVLFVIRTWVFGLFQIMPTKRPGLLLLRRQLHLRDKARKRMDELAWRYTVVRWHERRFARTAARFRPAWLTRPALNDALASRRHEAILWLWPPAVFHYGVACAP
jgi:hypothetical protein